MARVLTGVVVSTAMKDTIVVEVSRKTPHSLYKKLLTHSKRFKVAPGDKTVAVGDTVRISETRPLAKGKYFVVQEVVKQ